MIIKGKEKDKKTRLATFSYQYHKSVPKERHFDCRRWRYVNPYSSNRGGRQFGISLEGKICDIDFLVERSAAGDNGDIFVLTPTKHTIRPDKQELEVIAKDLGGKVKGEVIEVLATENSVVRAEGVIRATKSGKVACLDVDATGRIVYPLENQGFGRYLNSGLWIANGVSQEDVQKRSMIDDSMGRGDEDEAMSLVARGVNPQHCRLLDCSFRERKHYAERLEKVVNSLAEGEVVVVSMALCMHAVPLVIGRRTQEKGGGIVARLYDSNGYWRYRSSTSVRARKGFDKVFKSLGSSKKLLEDSAKHVEQMQGWSSTCSHHCEAFTRVASRYLDSFACNGKIKDVDAVMQSLETPEFRLQWANETIQILSNGEQSLDAEDISVKSTARLRKGVGVLKYKRIFNMRTLSRALSAIQTNPNAVITGLPIMRSRLKNVNEGDLMSSQIQDRSFIVPKPSIPSLKTVVVQDYVYRDTTLKTMRVSSKHRKEQKESTVDTVIDMREVDDKFNSVLGGMRRLSC